jgi:excinuclease UvrABC nuclease subunit
MLDKINKIPIEDAFVNGIYFLFDKEELVYVGQSNNVNSRIRQHCGKVDFDSFGYIMVPIDKELRNLEAYFIHKYKPKHNKKMAYNNVGLTNYHLFGSLKSPIDLEENLINYYGDMISKYII